MSDTAQTQPAEPNVHHAVTTSLLDTILTGRAAQLPRGILVGNVTDAAAATGCSVILAEQGAIASVAVRGGAPATRETDLLAPENMVQAIHAVVLSGGSAFGLDAASGVVRFLEERGVGLPFNGAVVPIVVGASLFDLSLGSAQQRPDAQMGYAAAAAAAPVLEATGNVGAGTGTSVGSFLGPDHAMKGGLGAASLRSGELLVTAIVAVNALGNVYDRQSGKYIAGALMESAESSRPSIAEPLDVLPLVLAAPLSPAANTTIGVVLTNAKMDKSQAHRVVGMAHDGLARAIYPAHSSFDGDALFALATGAVSAQVDVVGALAALVVEAAILDAVRSAQAAYGLLAAADLSGNENDTRG